ncbi:MAG: ABC-F family ATP-binding cassette domain-containing protein, partial [Phycisphaerales bacterium]|nr:ABC-F family ATP-binding cassette domain-containing protein [Phycisphaerales bacterium]
MPLIAATNIKKNYGVDIVLEGVSISIEDGERVGLVGRNGQGKSTLLKILGGLMPADSGEVSLMRGRRAGYLHQDPVFTPGETLRDAAEGAFAELHRVHAEMHKVFDAMAAAGDNAGELERLMQRQASLEREAELLGGYAIDHKIDAMLHGVGLTDKEFGVPVEGLSGGQKGRLALARLLLEEPDLLLLDEPTNHLDITGRMWLEEFLTREYRGAVVMVSHDRRLLDNVVNRIVEVEQGRLIDYPGGYEAFVEIRAQRRLTQARAHDKQQTKFRQQEAYIQRYKAGQRAKQAKGREKRLESEKEQRTLERPVELSSFQIELPKAPRSGDMVVMTNGLSKGYTNEDGQRRTLF